MKKIFSYIVLISILIGGVSFFFGTTKFVYADDTLADRINAAQESLSNNIAKTQRTIDTTRTDLAAAQTKLEILKKDPEEIKRSWVYPPGTMAGPSAPYQEITPAQKKLKDQIQQDENVISSSETTLDILNGEQPRMDQAYADYSSSSAAGNQVLALQAVKDAENIAKTDQQIADGTLTQDRAKANQAAVEARKAAGNTEDSSLCVFAHPIDGTWVGCLNTLALWVGNFVLSLAALFLYLVSILFDYIIGGTVAGMGGIVSRVSAIGVGWSAARDIANAIFIFVLLYLSIATILDLGTETKKQVVRVITMALLINFSLFFTNVMIDASNIIATGFYNATLKIAANQEGQIKHGTDSGTTLALGNTGSIASVFLNAISMQMIYNPEKMQAEGNDVFKDAQSNNSKDTPSFTNSKKGQVNISFWKIVVTSIFGTMFMFTTALVLLASVTLFGTRVGTLLVCMVFSPIAFALMAIPNDHYAKKLFWDKLIPQLLFAPVYMLFLYLTVQIVGNLEPGQFSGATKANVPDELGSIFAIFYNYIIVNTLLMTTLLSAQEIGIEGAAKAAEWVQAGKGALQSVVMRNSLGRMARYTDEKYASTTGKWIGGESLMGRQLRGVTTGYLKDSKFGGEKSYEDVYHEKHERASALITNEKMSKVKTALAGGKKDEIESAWGKLTTQEKSHFFETNKDLFHNPDTMKLLGHASSDTDMKSIRANEHITEEEKQLLRKGKYQDRIDIIKRLGEERNKYDQARSTGGKYYSVNKDGEYVDKDKKVVGKDHAHTIDFSQAESIKNYDKNKPAIGDWDEELADRIQKSSSAELIDMYDLEPELFTDNRLGLLVESIDEGPLLDLRKSGVMTSEQGRKLRLLKGAPPIKAAAKAYGIDIGAKEWQAMDIEAKQELVKNVDKFEKDGEQDAMGAYIASLPVEKRAELEKIHRGDKEWRKEGVAMYKNWMKGKGAGEFGIQRGVVRNSRLQTRLEGREVLQKKHDLDRVDKIKVLQPMMERYDDDSLNISQADASKAEYLLGDRTGKGFFTEQDAILDKNGNSIHPDTFVERAQVEHGLSEDAARKFVIDKFKWRARRDTARASGKSVDEQKKIAGSEPDPKKYLGKGEGGSNTKTKP